MHLPFSINNSSFILLPQLRLVILVFFGLFISRTYGQQNHLYIANDEHTDYIWTADAETYRQAFIDQLDYYISLMETKNSSLISQYQQRYNCDNSLWVYEYEKAKSASDFQRLINQIKSGHISVPFNVLIPMYGGQNAESALRGMYYAGYLERKYGINVDLVCSMENQTLPLGINSLWAGAGAKYSWKGVCNCKCPDLNFQNRKYEVYYSNGSDGKGVLMKWYDYKSLIELGGYAEIRNPLTAIGQLSDKCNTVNYPYDIAGAFGYGWDGLESYIDYLPSLAEAQSNASQQVFVSNESDFFTDFETKYASVTPSQSVSFGNDWDVTVASMAKVSGDIKQSVEKLRTAEALYSFVTLQDVSFAQNLASQRELAWISLGKYYDHDWTADGPASAGRPQFQRDMQANVSNYVNTLYDLSKAELGKLIIKSGANTRFYVFNPLSWTRDDVADFPYSGTLPVKIVDIVTKSEVPSQIVTIDGIQNVRILAPNIPSVGYKVFEIQPGIATSLPVAATFSNGVFENDYYKLTISQNGSVSSFQDKTDGNYEYNGSTALNDYGSGNFNSGTYTVENSGPVSVTVKCTSDSPYTHVNKITLYKSIKRVDIDDQLNQKIGNATVSYLFPFNLDNTTVWHEEVGAVLKARLESNGGQYSDQNANYNWLTANHFVYVGNSTRGMTVSNLGSHFFKLGNSTSFLLDENSSKIQFLAAGRVASDTLGFSFQAGDESFHYQFSLQPNVGSFNQTAAMRMALEHQNQLTTGLVVGGSCYPETTFSLIKFSSEDILLWSLKPAEEGAGKGIIARVWNQSNSGPLIIQGDLPVLAAKVTTNVENDINEANVLSSSMVDFVGTQEMKTFRIFFNTSNLVTNCDSDLIQQAEINVYPNPTKDELNISGKHFPNDWYYISITNMLGQAVYTDKTLITGNNFEKQINLKDFESGIYSLAISSAKMRQVIKIIKNK
jgi:alpha-mannosidase